MPAFLNMGLIARGSFWLGFSTLVFLGTLVYFLAREAPPSGVLIDEPGLREASGLAASTRTPGLLWALNDSRGQPLLFGLGANGARRATLRVSGVKNQDWESLASFQRDGRSWLAIGDTGDNGALRKNAVIHVIEEPSPESLSTTAEVAVRPTWSLPYRFENGPQDCEAIFVDAAAGELLLVQKRTRPAGVFRIDLTPPADGKPALARKVATLAHIPRPSSLQRMLPTPTGRYRAEPTGSALAPDGRSVAILTYGDVLLYERLPGANWADTFQGEPRRLAAHELSQAEAICYSFDGLALFVTGEQPQPRLLRYSLKR